MAFKHPVPVTFNHSNTQIPQFANICPDMTLPPNAVFVPATTGQGWTQPFMIQKGATHYDRDLAGSENGGNQNAYNSQLPNMKYWSVPRVNDGFGMTTNTSQAQCEAFADQMPLDCSLVVLETMENVNTLAPEAIQWKWFHDRWKVRCDNQTAIDGKPRWRCHNYFRFTGGIFALGHQSRELHRQLYTTPVGSWSSISYVDSFGQTQTAVNNYSPGRTLSSTNFITEGVYNGNPDADADTAMGSLFSMDTSRMQGKKPGLFLFGVQEWRPNWCEGTNYPDNGGSRLVRRNKVKLPPAVLMWSGFLGQEFGGSIGGASIEYGAGPYQPTSKKPVEYYAEIHSGNDFWKSPASAPNFSPFPYYGGTGPGRYNMGGGDYFYFGVKYWNDTVGQVYQGTPTFLRYQVDGGTIYEKAVAESDIVDARLDRRGLVRGRIHNGKMAVWYWNPYANMMKKTIKFWHPTNPSIFWERTVCGNCVHAELITL